jgi:hypothetical protein
MPRSDANRPDPIAEQGRVMQLEFHQRAAAMNPCGQGIANGSERCWPRWPLRKSRHQGKRGFYVA